MRCEQIPPDSSQWLEILAAVRHDFYHLPSYARLAADTENGTARAFVVDDPRGKLIVPLVIRAIDSDRFDAISPYGYAAPL
jgi:hypothetical protein